MVPSLPQNELTGNANTAPWTTVVLAAIVFLAIGMIGSNFPKVGKPLMALVIVVLIYEAYRTGI